MQHEIYDEFLISLIHYMHFYLLGITEKYFRLGIKNGRLQRMPGQLEIPLSKKRERRRKTFRFEVQNALMELAKKYVTLLYKLMDTDKAAGSIRCKYFSVVPERFFFESLLNVSCVAVCVAFLQRSNRLIRTEFGRLFRREAFNTDSLERRIECVEYETYAERALRVFEHSRHEKAQKQLADKLKPRLSPMSERARFTDPLAKPEIINWNVKIVDKPKIWTLKKKMPFYVRMASVPDKTDYVCGKHRVAVEQRQNTPLIELILGQDNQDVRDSLLHTVPELADQSLLAKMRPLRHDTPRLPLRWLTPYHKTLGIMGKPLRYFDYWTLLPAMNNEKKLTLPGLTRDARYRAFKTIRLLFPQRLHQATVRRKHSASQGHVKERGKDFPVDDGQLSVARSTKSFPPNKMPVKMH
ncbi:uncharacterized protein LOC129587091 isoform X2 [Paramacrobiotus metropolitanus]|nr:uncharacterized protein LOC129587091 isoform X2 [Paramacrobiotus metropolitanus]